jgi:hypothetical protein
MLTCWFIAHNSLKYKFTCKTLVSRILRGREKGSAVQPFESLKNVKKNTEYVGAMR